MADPFVTVERRPDGVALIRLDRPKAIALSGTGFPPGGGGTRCLPRLIGSSRAKDLIMTGRPVRADVGQALGLVNCVVAPDEVLSSALAWAAEFALGPLVAHGLAKRAIDRGLESTLADALEMEQDALAAVAQTEDASRMASFAAHGPGKATFLGR